MTLQIRIEVDQRAELHRAVEPGRRSARNTGLFGIVNQDRNNPRDIQLGAAVQHRAGGVVRPRPDRARRAAARRPSAGRARFRDPDRGQPADGPCRSSRAGGDGRRAIAARLGHLHPRRPAVARLRAAELSGGAPRLHARGNVRGAAHPRGRCGRARAERAQPDQMATLADEVAGMFASMDDPRVFLVHDINFHRGVAAASGNPIVASLVEMVSALYYERRRDTAARASRARPAGRRRDAPADLSGDSRAQRRRPRATRCTLTSSRRLITRRRSRPTPPETRRQRGRARLRGGHAADAQRPLMSIFDLSGRTAVVAGGTSGKRLMSFSADGAPLKVYGRKFPVFDNSHVKRKRVGRSRPDRETDRLSTFTEDTFDPGFVSGGKEYLIATAGKALEELRLAKVPSAAFPGEAARGCHSSAGHHHACGHRADR